MPKAALYGLGDSVRIENHGLLQTTASSRRTGISINTAAPGGVGEVINRGNILLNHAGFTSGTGISVCAGIGGSASVENFADMKMGGSSTGIGLYGRAGTHLSLLNDGLIESDTYFGVLVSGEATTTSPVHNDKGGHIVSRSRRA